MSRAAINAQLAQQAAALGLQINPGPNDKGGGGAFTRYLQSLIASYRPPTPAPPPPPPTPQPIQQPLEVTNRARLSTSGQSKRKRPKSAVSTQKKQLSFGLNAPGRSTEGGISF